MKMKKSNLYEIRELARRSGRSVYSIQQLANLIAKPKGIAKVYASRLVQKGLAKRILRGKISFSTDDYVIASQLIEPAYVSLSSALLFHKLIKQVPAFVECVNTRNSRRFLELGIVYHKMPPSLFFGYERQGRDGSYAFIADAEKALIDSVYFGSISKKDAHDAMKEVRSEKINNYLERYKGRGKAKLKRWLE
ncbi:MAG: hypothetical protein V1835_07450 [Candidatus Micrarchaeota archaeon]